METTSLDSARASVCLGEAENSDNVASASYRRRLE